jgi:Mn-dependent DtxR family transcriptional regulator
LKEDRSAKVLDLAKLFKVTEVTIRQDLEKLDKDGLVIREHGGAYLKDVSNQVKGFAHMHKLNLSFCVFVLSFCLYAQNNTRLVFAGHTSRQFGHL